MIFGNGYLCWSGFVKLINSPDQSQPVGQAWCTLILAEGGIVRQITSVDIRTYEYNNAMISNSIGFLGGTGEEGRGIALRLASGRQRVLIGSRSHDSASKAVSWINEQAGEEVATAATNIEVVRNCEFLFLTVPFRFAGEVIEEAWNYFQTGQVVVDVTVPLSFEKGPQLLPLEEGSGGEYIRSLLPPSVGLVAAFKTLPAHLLVDIYEPLDCDEFICGDSPETIEKVIQILGGIPELRWINAGPLSSCRSLEAMTLLAIRLNRKYKSRLGRYRFLGI